MENSHIYLKGIYFEQDFKDVQESHSFIDDVLGDVPHLKDNLKVFIKNKAVYFVTEQIDEPDVIYSQLKLDSSEKPHEHLYLYHFFDIDEIKNNHFKTYALISNIENYQRLLISFACVISPNLPYKFAKNDNGNCSIEKYKYVHNDTIHAYISYLKFDTNITFSKLFGGNDMNSLYNKHIDEYKKILPIYDCIENLEHNYIGDVRGAINHNSLHRRKWKNMVSYTDDIKKLTEISEKLEEGLNYVMLKYSI